MPGVFEAWCSRSPVWLELSDHGEESGSWGEGHGRGGGAVEGRWRGAH